MTDPSPDARALAQALHDEIRADIPQKIMGKSVRPPAWTEERLDYIADLIDQAIDARIQAALNRRAA